MKNGLEYSWFLNSQAVSIEMDKQSQPTSDLGVKSFLYLLGMCWCGNFHWCCQFFDTNAKLTLVTRRPTCHPEIF